MKPRRVSGEAHLMEVCLSWRGSFLGTIDKSSLGLDLVYKSGDRSPRGIL